MDQSKSSVYPTEEVRVRYKDSSLNAVNGACYLLSVTVKCVIKDAELLNVTVGGTFSYHRA
jgi:hypothetical protein